MDREKVIKKAERIMCSTVDRNMIDAFCEDVIGLLKEQEAVMRTSRTGINGFSIIWTCGSCGSDLHPNNAKAKFCSNCGRPVKWE